MKKTLSYSSFALQSIQAFVSHKVNHRNCEISSSSALRYSNLFISFLITFIVLLFTCSAYAARWDFPSGTDGWTGRNCSTSTSGGGYLFCVTTTTVSDPGVVSPANLNLSASLNQLIKFSMLSQWADSTGHIYFTTTTSPSFDETKKVFFSVTNNGAWYPYTVDMSVNAVWSGTISQIRIDSANNGVLNKRVEFDWIETSPKVITPTHTVSKTSMMVGESVTLTCGLTSAGAGRTVAFFVQNGSTTVSSTTRTTDSSGNASWAQTAQSNWQPSVSTQCRDESTMTTSSRLNITVNPPLLSPPALQSPIGGVKVYQDASGKVNLNWASVSGNNGYLMIVDSMSPMTMSVNQTTYAASLSAGATHTWQMCTKNSAGICGAYSSPVQSFYILPTPTISSTSYSINVGDSVTLTCDLSSAGAGRGVDIRINNQAGQTISSIQNVTTNGSGTYSWPRTSDSSWLPKVSVVCLDYATQKASLFKDITVNPPLLSPPVLQSPIGGAKLYQDTNGKINLNWQNVSGNNGYLMIVDSMSPMTMSVNQTTYAASLSAGATHTWQMCTKNSADICGSYSSPVQSFYVLPTPTISSTSYSINVGDSITLTCDLSTAGAGRGVDFRINNQSGTTISSLQNVTTNGSGTYSWPRTSDSNWVPEVSVVCLDYTTQTASTYKDITVTSDDTGTVTGGVRNALTNALLTGATVRLEQSGVRKYTTTTNASGVYTITNVTPGSYNDVGLATGYQNLSIPITVTAGQTTSQNLALTPLPSASPVFVPLFRLYKYDSANNTRDHFYTTNSLERDSAINTKNYTYIGIECYISDRNFVGGIPLYRLYRSDVNSHYYTTSETEKVAKLSSGYVDEGIIGFLYQDSAEGLISFHRLHQTISTTFHYFMCSKKHEYDNAIITHAQDWGFVDEGVVGYVSPNGLNNPVAHNRPQGNYSGIDTATGAFRPVSFTDLSLDGVGPPLVFTRYYNSFNYSEIPLGPGWSHSLYSYVLEDPNGNVVIKWGNGTESYFFNDGSDNFTPAAGNFDTLVRFNDGYNLTTKTQTLYEFRRMSVSPPPGAEMFIPSVVLINIEDKNGNRMGFSYDAAYGTLYEVRDTSGRTFSLQYDASLRLTRVIDNALNRSIVLGYTNGYLTSCTDARGNTTTYTYNSDNLLSTITLPEQNTLIMTYDQQRITGFTNGNITLSVDYTNGTTIETPDAPDGSTTYVHDTLDRVTEIKDANLNSINISYYTGNLLNLPSTLTDRNSNPSSFTYDSRGNILTITNALNQITTFTYDEKNNLLSTKNHRNYTTIYNYDSNKKNLMNIQYPMGGVTSMTYFSNGLVETVSDPNNHVITNTYNSHGNLTRVTDNALGTHIDFTYDNVGRLQTKTDQLNKTTAYTYDANDNVTQVQDPDNNSAIYTYDTNNRLIKLTDTRGKITNYTYNGMNLLASETDPVFKTYQYGYDSRGNVSSITDPDGNVTTYTYDVNNRLTEIKFNNVSKIRFTEYDANGNLKSMVDENGTTSFTYDELNRVKSYSNSLVNKTVSYEYDASGNRSKIIYPGSKEVIYNYDGDNRLSTVTDWLNGVTTYVYDNAGILRSVTNPNGTTTAYSYDNANRLTGLSNKKSNNTVISDYAFILNAVGNPTQSTINEPSTATFSPIDIPYAYDDANRITSAGSITYTHESSGNLSGTNTGNIYSFNFSNRLIQVTVGGEIINYLYDGFRNRIARAKNNVQTRYVLDLNGEMSQVLAETDSNGSITNYYTYGLGLISKITPANQRYVYHFDSIGNTIALSDSSENITEKYAYDEFGKALSVSATLNIDNPFRYVGQYGVMDEENGLLFMRARYYDVETGRFVSKDPLGYEGGDLNLYAYVEDNPIVDIDPEGLRNWRKIKLGEDILDAVGRFSGVKSVQLETMLMIKESSQRGPNFLPPHSGAVKALKITSGITDAYQIIKGGLMTLDILRGARHTKPSEAFETAVGLTGVAIALGGAPIVGTLVGMSVGTVKMEAEACRSLEYLSRGKIKCPNLIRNIR